MKLNALIAGATGLYLGWRVAHIIKGRQIAADDVNDLGVDARLCGGVRRCKLKASVAGLACLRARREAPGFAFRSGAADNVETLDWTCRCSNARYSRRGR